MSILSRSKIPYPHGFTFALTAIMYMYESKRQIGKYLILLKGKGNKDECRYACVPFDSGYLKFGIQAFEGMKSPQVRVVGTSQQWSPGLAEKDSTLALWTKKEGGAEK